MKRLLVLPVALLAALAGAATRTLQDQCGPFTDVSALFCPYVLEAYYTGITAGTSPTTFSPDVPITRGQAAVFVTKGLNQALARGSRRAALGQWWAGAASLWNLGLGVTTLPSLTGPVACDGQDLWVAGGVGVYRIRASDGTLLSTWTVGAGGVSSIVIADGRVFAAGSPSLNAQLYMIDPSQPPGAAPVVATLLSGGQNLLAFDGARIWATNLGPSVGIVTPSASTPWPTTVVKGFQFAAGIAFDGQNMWVADTGANTLFKLDSTGAVKQTVAGTSGKSLTFDGSNILVPNGALQAVRVSDGTLIATIPVASGEPSKIVSDGERLLVIGTGAGQSTQPSLTLLRTADFSIIQVDRFDPLLGEVPIDGASDGINFWVTTYLEGGFAISLVRY